MEGKKKSIHKPGNKGRRGGAQPGSGRPRHSQDKSTIEREEAIRQFKERVAKSTHKLFEAQMDLAIGEKYLMVIRTIGKGARARRETEIVSDPDLVRQYFDGELGDSNDEEYYFISTKPANNQALDSLLNRTFGRPKEDDENPETLNVKFEVVNKVPEPKD